MSNSSMTDVMTELETAWRLVPDWPFGQFIDTFRRWVEWRTRRTFLNINNEDLKEYLIEFASHIVSIDDEY